MKAACHLKSTKMKRILITGNAGAGKSTLANDVASRLEFRYVCLDRLVWRSGWAQTPRGKRDRRIREIANEEAWVIDGVSDIALGAADTVVFLNVSRRVSYWRVAKRNWKFLFRSRPDLHSGYLEIMIIPTLFRIIWHFPLRVRPDILRHVS